MNELEEIGMWRCIICGEIFYDLPQYCEKDICEECCEELFDRIDQDENQH